MKALIFLLILAIVPVRIAPATIVEINDDLITVEVESGDLYEFYGDEFSEGQEITVVFNGDQLVNAF